MRGWTTFAPAAPTIARISALRRTDGGREGIDPNERFTHYPWNFNAFKLCTTSN
jgi:hypothetical protein